MVLEDLVRVYDSYLESKLAVVETGEKPFWGSLGVDGFIPIAGLSNKELLNLRKEILLGKILQKLRDLPPEAVKKVETRVDHPVLAGIFYDTPSDISPKELSEKRLYDWGTINHAVNLLKPLVLLCAIERHPEVADLLEEDSAYFPHRLFARQRERPATIADVEMEIAAAIPEVYSEEMVAALDRLGEFISNPMNLTSATFSDAKRLGKFTLYSCGRDAPQWNISKDGLEEFERVYGELDLKREAYHALLEVTNLVGSNASSKNKKIKNLPNFRTSSSEYAIVIQGANMFAQNQILYAWQNSQGAKAHVTLFGRRLGFQAAVLGEELRILHRGELKTCRGWESPSYLNSSDRLPNTLCLLKRRYETARKLLQSA